MSSHHFVKEGQEPSVWILGTEFSEETLGTLLEWSPLVIATLPAAEKLLSLQIKIDQIITETENTDSETFFTSLYPIEWKKTENVLSVLWQFTEQQQAHLYLTGINEQLLQEIFSLVPVHLKQYLIGITLTQKWICPPVVWRKWMAQGQQFSLTGSLSGWEIHGNVSERNNIIYSEADQLILFKNKNQQCFIEHLSTSP